MHFIKQADQFHASADPLVGRLQRSHQIHGLRRRELSGTQLRNAISARSNFGLGFALTHILIKSDESHRRKSIFDLAVADFDLAAAD